VSTLLIATGCAILFSALLTPLVLRMAVRWGIVDHPDGIRKLHAQPVPLGGGVAIVLAYFAVLAGIELFPNPWQSRIVGETPYLVGLVLSTALICLLGLIDDRYKLRGRQKLAGQLVAVSVIVASGVVIRRFTIFEYGVDLGMLSIPFTVFWLMGAINALNLIDGVDGLATSIGVVFSVALGAMAFATGHEFDALLALALAGSLAGFLIYNFPPAKIFLGDSGSMVIGLVLGVLAIRASLKGPATVALAAPTAVWTVLIFDVSMAIVRRKLTGRSLYTTDRGHLHHALLQKGVSGARIVIWVGLLCAICGAGALASICYQNDLLAIGSALAVIGTLVLTRFFGYSEVSLLVRSVRSFVGTLLRLPNPRGDSAPLSSRFQGNREWDKLWHRIIEYADEHDLCMVQLNVNLPALHEEYHAVWKRRHGGEQDQMWHATLPLMAGEQSIGRLRVAGLASPIDSVSESLADLIAGLRPFEDEVLEKADFKELPAGLVEMSPPHLRTAHPAIPQTEREMVRQHAGR
jgi:UDP-GlcNAc:undecaprenyl-phosphate/decaprenyl-phosphate GlcNAc-1-phosphate transferase